MTAGRRCPLHMRSRKSPASPHTAGLTTAGAQLRSRWQRADVLLCTAFCSRDGGSGELWCSLGRVTEEAQLLSVADCQQNARTLFDARIRIREILTSLLFVLHATAGEEAEV